MLRYHDGFIEGVYLATKIYTNPISHLPNYNEIVMGAVEKIIEQMSIEIKKENEK